MSKKISICGPIHAVRRFWMGYVNFKGTATRSEFWFGLLFVFLLRMFTAVFATGLGIPDLLNWIVLIITILPSVSLFVRRFHAAGLSGLYFIVPYASLVLWAVVRGQAWHRLIAMDYIPMDASGFVSFGFVFFVFWFVVGCMPNKK